ncbi:hypothetical protein [Niastella populi]|uniref:Uncharacterized protein n=1 Tax=Niastella populi TaxID=550983 RepID=A0A1V9G850_9BACT|nr:hypothetical protein [Niastella populi]OQP66724.1 hypothetical protein A4R26_13205 [Niastella populi]
MKTSNKILIGIFLAVIILTTSIHLYVYAKYKRGDYVPFQRESAVFMDRVDVPGAKFVSITGLGGVELINSDTAKFETDKDNVGRISYKMVKDTLVITDPTLTDEQLERGGRNYQRFKLYLPPSVPVQTAFCSINAKGAVDSTHAASYKIALTRNSNLSIRNDNRASYFDQLLIKGESAEIVLEDQAIINDLHVQLVHSSINDMKATIQSITVEADPQSSLNLSGKNIKALK